MKILFITDSHRHFSFLVEMMEKEKPERVFAMGDYTKDFEELSYLYSEIPFEIVKGNCDFWDSHFSEEKIIFLEGKRIFLTHGHLYGVKSNYNSLRKMGRKMKCDIILFGHTHREFLEEKDMILANPGAAQDGKYGILDLQKEKVEIKLKRL
ncbi:metallophosphoesterase [Fusobacterium necrophorum]|uniref:Phosphoesterase n=2 Tax=Fusobacterium necrophorum TaxID=859 RepID=A0AB73BVP7_9FUSO|nr:metallophosphoesterase [Fusobacterium necrophorum]AYZ73521.1 metallophosphoesterase [Fusobacterium necrophorum]AZW08478.1 metallophosphoesterase [Fusobacterium necrophorum subsp. necrophorum]KDE62408.1 MJ0936 family phosphodiesterase [Fusobacterium necrophorum DJ-1]KDE62835.1 MJ0936 family phosphodiesterase [Fusobacterium necrophorum BL]KDE65081.1 MJ0936 family phosphodiesterase [Fusobacterium necrophorum BFTR-1]